MNARRAALRGAWIAPVCLLLTFGAAWSRAADPPKQPSQGNVAPYYPTPIEVAKSMLEAGDLQAGQLHVDLGSGDGRLVILAARNFGARSIGYELDSKLVDSSRRQIEEMGLSPQASIIQRDLFQADMTEVDLVTVYLLPRALKLLRPIFERDLKKGAVVVSHDFPMPEWEPAERIEHEEENEVDGLPHTIYVYRR